MPDNLVLQRRRGGPCRVDWIWVMRGGLDGNPVEVMTPSQRANRPT